MKSTYYLILFFTTIIFAQDKSFYLSIGKPLVTSAASNSKNFSLGLQYQNRFSESFGYDVLLEYVQNNTFPSFYDDPQALNQYILSKTRNEILYNSSWSKINILNVGSRINYLFVNNKKLLFCFHGGLGYLFSRSSAHLLKSLSYDMNTGQVFNYDNETIKGNLATLYYSLGMQFQYTFYKNYFIGINPFFLDTIGDKKLNNIPVHPSYNNLTLNIGKKF